MSNSYKTGVELRCKQCGKSFIYKKRKTGKKFCSHECYLKFLDTQRKRKTCPVCKKEFIVVNNNKTCSIKCRNINQEKKSLIKCKNCGKPILLPPSVMAYRSFCGMKCRKIWLRKNLKGVNNPNWKGGQIKCVCIKCGKEFYIKSGRKKASYCSMKCLGTSLAGRKLGARKEREAKKELESQGYYVTKSGGSLGVFDLLAVNDKIGRAIQVKSTRINLKLKNYKKDVKQMREVQLPGNFKKEIWIWYYMKGWEKHEI